MAASSRQLRKLWRATLKWHEPRRNVVDPALFHLANSRDDEEQSPPSSRSRGLFHSHSFTFQNAPVGRSSLAWIRSARVPGPCLLARYSSTAGERLEDELGGLPTGLNDVSQPTSEVLTSVDGGVVADIGASQAVSEVAAVIGDCSYPTAMLQLLIESVHLHAGLPWWAAIAVTTAGIRLATVPVVIYQIKSAARLTLMRPELEKINAEMKESGYDPTVAADARERMKGIFKKHNTTPFSPFVGAVLQAPIFICFFFAIQNMAQRVESFKNGGFLWFTDLSTADSTYTLPLFAALTVLITVELGAAEGMEGNPIAHKMKTFMRIFAAAVFPLTLHFEKALFCYWITSNFWSLCQSAILKSRAVKFALGIPDLSHLAQEQALAVKPLETVTRPAKRIRRKNQKNSRR